jgi:site-specific DNA recombinase
VDKRLAALGREASEAEGRLRRLYQLIENGHAEMDDFLRERILTLKAERDRANATLDRARSAVRPVIDITAAQAERFGTLMRKNLTSGEIPFRKAYMAAIIDRVEVDDRQIRIVGRKDVLEQAVLANGAVTPGVRSFVRKWLGRGR